MADTVTAATPAVPTPEPDMRTARFRKYTLKELFEFVDMDRGQFSIGFKKRNSDLARRLRDGERVQSEYRTYEKFAHSILGYRGDKKPSGLFAWLARHLTIAVEEYNRAFTYVHCEPAFFLGKKGNEKFGADNMLCVAASAASPLQIYPRLFNDEYEWVDVGATRAELEAMLGRVCRMQGDRFDFGGMSRCLLAAGPDERRGWYCSYVVASLLELLGVPSGHTVRPNTLSVDDVYEIVCDKEFDPEVHVSFARRAFDRSLNDILSKFGVDEVV